MSGKTPPADDLASIARFPGSRHAGTAVLHFASLDSTNTYAKRIAAASAHGTVVVADRQRRGRGRGGRQWFSPPGKNLYFSIILKKRHRSAFIPRLTAAALVAVVETARRMTGKKAVTKWPNDVFYRGRKIAGILAETSSRSGRAEYTVIGVGINVNMRRRDFPRGLRDRATSLSSMARKTLSRVRVLRAVLARFEKAAVLPKREILKKLKKYSCIIDKRIRVRTGRVERAGTVFDINGDFSLRLVEHDGTVTDVADGVLLVGERMAGTAKADAAKADAGRGEKDESKIKKVGETIQEIPDQVKKTYKDLHGKVAKLEFEPLPSKLLALGILVGGCLIMFFGWKMYRFALALSGAFMFSVFAYIVMKNVPVEETWLIMLVSAVCGVIGSILAFMLEKAALVVFGGMIGLIPGYAVGAMFPGELAEVVGAMGGAVVCALVMLIMFRFLMVIGLSFVGAFMFGFGVLNFLVLMDFLAPAKAPIPLFAFTLVFTFIGSMHQLRAMEEAEEPLRPPKEKERDEEVKKPT